MSKKRKQPQFGGPLPLHQPVEPSCGPLPGPCDYHSNQSQPSECFQPSECCFTPPLHALGRCPHCGAPIYGPTTISQGSEQIEVRFSCSCTAKSREKKSRSFADYIQTK